MFVEDEAVPIWLIARLWQSTGGLSAAETRTLCGRCGSLWLVTLGGWGCSWCPSRGLASGLQRRVAGTYSTRDGNGRTADMTVQIRFQRHALLPQ